MVHVIDDAAGDAARVLSGDGRGDAAGCGYDDEESDSQG
jgi:hypothetical protein